jgi:Flp pilus assembly protein TadD
MAKKAARASIKSGGGTAAKAAARSSGAKKANAPQKRAESANELIDAAQAALAYDDYDRALTLLRRAAAREPDSADAAEALGALLAELGELAEAEAVRFCFVCLAGPLGFSYTFYWEQT